LILNKEQVEGFKKMRKAHDKDAAIDDLLDTIADKDAQIWELKREWRDRSKCCMIFDAENTELRNQIERLQAQVEKCGETLKYIQKQYYSPIGISAKGRNKVDEALEAIEKAPE
jgi:chromosome segregation ATPase